MSSMRTPPSAGPVHRLSPGGQTDLAREFHEEMVGVYRAARDRYGYVATRFLQMVAQRGGVQAAKDLLRTPGMPSGLIELWHLHALDISMEACILADPRWWPLFTKDELETARKRLAELGYRAGSSDGSE